jgi:hypothetical protein
VHGQIFLPVSLANLTRSRLLSSRHSWIVYTAKPQNKESTQPAITIAVSFARLNSPAEDDLLPIHVPASAISDVAKGNCKRGLSLVGELLI